MPKLWISASRPPLIFRHNCVIYKIPRVLLVLCITITFGTQSNIRIFHHCFNLLQVLTATIDDCNLLVSIKIILSKFIQYLIKNISLSDGKIKFASIQDNYAYQWVANIFSQLIDSVSNEDHFSLPSFSNLTMSSLISLIIILMCLDKHTLIVNTFFTTNNLNMF